MNEEKTSNIHPGKAIFSMITTVVLAIVLPYLAITQLLPLAPIPIDPGIITLLTNSIILYGCIGAVISFFTALFSPGTRPHGIFSAIFSAYSVYYLYFLFTGGLSGNFGVFTIDLGIFPVPTQLQSFSFGFDLSIIAWWFIISGGITILLYIYEIIA